MTTANAALAILGGTFDPPHIGHLITAQDAAEALGVTDVCLIPAAQNPFKKIAPGASDSHRLGMLNALCQRWQHLSVDTFELDAGGTSYTVDTAEYLKKQAPDRTLYWIIGSDQLEHLPQWKAIDRLAQLVEFVCLTRPGYEPAIPQNIEHLVLHHFERHSISISSTDIRKRLAQGMPVELFLPEPVLHYIQTHQLYMKPEPNIYA